MSELSIIVPVYKVEKYLQHCLNSILAQSFSDFELILVDDGSPDHCGDIIEENAKNDNRIITIHQDNQGVSAARNAGLSIAKGKYVGFVDADDRIAPQMYEKIISAMIESSAQLGIVSCTNVSSSIPKEPKQESPQIEHLSQLDMAKAMFHIPKTVSDSACNKVFLRKLISTKFDTQRHMCEDSIFVVNYIENISEAVWVKEPMYFINAREGSATRSDPAVYLEALEARKHISTIIKSGELTEAYYYAFWDYFDTCIRSLHKQLPQSEARIVIRSRIRKELREVLNNPVIPIRTKLGYIFQFVLEH